MRGRGRGRGRAEPRGVTWPADRPRGQVRAVVLTWSVSSPGSHPPQLADRRTVRQTDSRPEAGRQRDRLDWRTGETNADTRGSLYIDLAPTGGRPASGGAPRRPPESAHTSAQDRWRRASPRRRAGRQLRWRAMGGWWRRPHRAGRRRPARRLRARHRRMNGYCRCYG